MGNEFATIDQMLPIKKKQKPDDRAKVPSEPFTDDIEKMSAPFVSMKQRSPEDRQKDVNDIADWIRNGSPSDDDSPTNEFATIDQMLPPKKKQSPDDRAKDIEGVLNW